MSDAQSSRQHARLAPSAAHRWSACPGSVLMESHVEDRASAAANEGTAAHELAAWVLRDSTRTADYMLGRVIDIEGDSTATRFLKKGASPNDMTRWRVTEEMVEAVTEFVDFVRGTGGEIAVETRLDITHVHPGIWGTGDALCYVEAEKHLYVADLKYGRGVVVEAEENEQLSLYAAGAAKRYHNRGVDRVTMAIIQPRAPHPKGPVRVETIGIAELSARERKLQSAAAATDVAAARLREMVHADWCAEFLVPGDHCRFCKVGATCPARAEQSIRDAQAEFAEDGTMTLPPVAQLSQEQLGDLLTRARKIQHWINAVEEHANAQALAGTIPTGFKLVEKRAQRRWTDEEVVASIAPVLLSVDPGDLFAPPKLLSPAQLEKKLSKDERASLAAFITKSSSGVNLVPVDDARPSIRPDAESEFEAI